MLRVWLRTLLLLVSLIAISLGVVVDRYHRQSQAIADFMRRDVYIYAEYDGPASLLWLLHGSGLFFRPMQAQVLLEGAGGNQVRCFGQVQPSENIEVCLREMQHELHSRLGLQSFLLVLGRRELPTRVLTELGRLQMDGSESRLWFW